MINCLKISFGSVFVVLILCYLLSSLFFTLLVPILLTEIIGFFIVGLIIVKSLFLSKLQANLMLFFLCLLPFYIKNLINEEYSEVLFSGFKDSIRYYFFLLLIINLCNKNYVKSLISFIYRYYTKIYSFLLIISIFNLFCLTQDSCYSNQWNGKYFILFSFSNHSCASSICLLMALKLLCLNCFNKINLLHLILLLLDFFVILQTGARTFIIPSLVILIVAYKYFRYDLLFTWFKYMLPLFIPIVILNSKIIDKIKMLINEFGENSVNSSSLLDYLSSYRMSIWSCNISSYLNSDLFNILFGNGFDFSYFVNSIYVNNKIWAHSDIVSVLVSTGVFGLLLYLVVLIALVLMVKNKKMRFWCCMYFFIPMIFNGFYPYQHLLFSFVFVFCFAVSYSESSHKDSANLVF